MKKVQLTKDHNGRHKGEVLNVDDNSAAALIADKVATEYSGGKVVAPKPKPGVVHVQQVRDADPGPAAAGEAKKDDEAKKGDDGQPGPAKAPVAAK